MKIYPMLNEQRQREREALLKRIHRTEALLDRPYRDDCLVLLQEQLQKKPNQEYWREPKPLLQRIRERNEEALDQRDRETLLEILQQQLDKQIIKQKKTTTSGKGHLKIVRPNTK